jgi:hypothetical protein
MSDELINNSISAFWSWFTKHEQDMKTIRTAEGKCFVDLIDHLHQIDAGLFAEICTESHPCDLVITAGGLLRLIPLVERVVSAAPAIPGWTFTALKPAHGFDFKTSYEGVAFDPKAMWFLPLESKSRPEQFAIRVGVPDYDETRRKQTLAAIFIILDTALGERCVASDIHYIEAAEVPSEPEKCGYIEMVELPQFIQWWKSKRARRQANV